ncbi:hypothetical protein DEO72_LG7g1446 [Vigna unguiculata]|uniref:Uncharacterized protein n=1 Tax=Vigna unguiculata TaxID=3917 RepID=A0A4D6MIZ5_VIGUN|nr:hypothetical protein DEO72_LG7g1446 [Vigna unguiculata]
MVTSRKVLGTFLSRGSKGSRIGDECKEPPLSRIGEEGREGSVVVGRPLYSPNATTLSHPTKPPPPLTRSRVKPSQQRVPPPRPPLMALRPSMVDCALTLLFCALLQVGGAVAESSCSWCVKMALVLTYPKQKSPSMAPVPLQSRPKVPPFGLISICLGSKTEAK